MSNDQDNSAPELSPCPFCGAAAGDIKLGRGHGYIIGCGMCQGQQFALTRDEAVKLWNTRADLARSLPSVPDDAVATFREVAVLLDQLDWVIGYELTEQNQRILDKAVETARAALVSTEKCIWGSDDDGLWDSACGVAFQFTDGGPEANEFKFCYRCGKLIEIVRTGEDETDE